MITPMALNDAVSSFLRDTVASKQKLKQYSIDGESVYKHPQIVTGFILPKTIDSKEDDISEFPYICNQISSIKNIENTRLCIVTIKTSIGTYCPGVFDDLGIFQEDSSGYRDVWNLIEECRQALFSKGVLEDRFSIVQDYFDASMPQEQPYPFWEGFFYTKWEVGFQLKKKEGFYAK